MALPGGFLESWLPSSDPVPGPVPAQVPRCPWWGQPSSPAPSAMECPRGKPQVAEPLPAWAPRCPSRSLGGAGRGSHRTPCCPALQAGGPLTFTLWRGGSLRGESMGPVGCPKYSGQSPVGAGGLGSTQQEVGATCRGGGRPLLLAGWWPRDRDVWAPAGGSGQTGVWSGRAAPQRAHLRHS